MAIRNCVVCGGEFERGQRNAISCSAKCVSERRAKQKRDRRTEDPQKYRDQDKRTRTNNSDRIRENQRLWALRNPEKLRERDRRQITKLRFANRLIKELENRLAELETGNLL